MDEIENWRRNGVNVVVSLLTPEEEFDLGLLDEKPIAASQGLELLSNPMPDRDIPPSDAQLAATLDQVDRALTAGKNVIVHLGKALAGPDWLRHACLLHGDIRLVPL